MSEKESKKKKHNKCTKKGTSIIPSVNLGKNSIGVGSITLNDVQVNMQKLNIQKSLDKGEEVFNQAYKEKFFIIGDEILPPNMPVKPLSTIRAILLTPTIRAILWKHSQGYGMNQKEIHDLIDERLIKMGFIESSLLDRIKITLKKWFRSYPYGGNYTKK